MKIEQVLSAKALWFMDVARLNPRGRSLYRVVVPALVEWYGFKPPAEPYNEQAGVFFNGGEFSLNNDGQQMTGVNAAVYFNGILAQTTTNTDDSDRFLDQVLRRLAEAGHIEFNPEWVQTRSYVSEVVARTLKSLTFPGLSDVCNILSSVGYPGMEGQPFKPSGIVIDTDPTTPNRLQPQFTLERRVGKPWSENLYFSQAPLSTSKHQGVLDEIEKVLTALASRA
jgi:hypothetical protein